MKNIPDCDVVVVGAGFAGIYALWTAEQRGLSVRGFENAADVGGTWYWNSYPGARCDVSSYNYAYFFNSDIVRKWDWPEVCSAQPDIQKYLRYVAEQCDVLKSITFNTKVVSVQYDEETGLWTVSTSRGEEVVCRYVVLAIGALSAPKTPDIPGVDSFAGKVLFTSDWPKDEPVDLRGKRIGVVGTGSSGVQLIPEMAKIASELYVFQRTANYVVPIDAGPIDQELMASLRKDPQAIRADLRETYGGNQVFKIGQHRFHDLDEEGLKRELEKAWDGRYIALAFRDAHLPEPNQAISEFIRKKIQEQIKDPQTAHRLVPWDHPYGGKRPCMSNVYYQTFNLPHVHLISLKETSIKQITTDGVETTAEKIPLDVLIYATGFDAISGPVFAIDIRGVDGVALKDVWKDGPVNYLGTMVHGFPNLFLPSSALSPSVLANMATLAEQQVDFIFDSIEWLDNHGRARLHPKVESQRDWQEQNNYYASRRPGALTTNSWYSGGNIPGKPRVFMIYCGGFRKYNDLCYSELKDGFPGYEVAEAASKAA